MPPTNACSGAKTYTDELTHWPLPASLGEISTGCGRPACSSVMVSGTMGWLKITVTFVWGSISSASGSGKTCPTSRLSTVVKLSWTGSLGDTPLALTALVENTARYRAAGFNSASGLNANVRLLTQDDTPLRVLPSGPMNANADPVSPWFIS